MRSRGRSFQADEVAQAAGKVDLGKGQSTFPTCREAGSSNWKCTLTRSFGCGRQPGLDDDLRRRSHRASCACLRRVCSACAAVGETRARPRVNSGARRPDARPGHSASQGCGKTRAAAAGLLFGAFQRQRQADKQRFGPPFRMQQVRGAANPVRCRHWRRLQAHARCGSDPLPTATPMRRRRSRSRARWQEILWNRFDLHIIFKEQIGCHPRAASIVSIYACPA